MRRIYLKRKTS